MKPKCFLAKIITSPLMTGLIVLIAVIAAALAVPLIKHDCERDVCWIAAHPEDDVPQEVEPGLWIGNMFAAANDAALRQRNITHIVTAIGEPNGGRLSDIEYLVMDFADGYGEDLRAHFVRAHVFIERVRLSGGIVLIHCAAGVSRSASIAITHLMLRHLISFGDALTRVRMARSVVRPNPWFVRLLEDLDPTRPAREL